MQTSFVQLAVYEMAVPWLAGSYSSETEPRCLLVETTRPFPHPPPPPSLLGQGDAVESKASLAEFWQREKKRRVGCQANFSVVPPPCAVNLSRIPWLLGIEFLPFSHPWRQESLVSTQSPPTFQASSVGEPSQCGWWNQSGLARGHTCSGEGERLRRWSGGGREWQQGSPC